MCLFAEVGQNVAHSPNRPARIAIGAGMRGQQYFVRTIYKLNCLAKISFIDHC